MPYKTNKDLPEKLRKNLPSGAQTIYRKAFNNAIEHYEKSEKRRYGRTQEETAHSVSWAAVKQVYLKKDNKWVKKK